VTEFVKPNRRTEQARAIRRRIAADIIFTLASAEVYLLLTVECGWSPAQWQSWVTDAIAQASLR
jgi:hypothetical protein